MRVSWRGAAFGALLVVYLVVTLGVVFKSPLLHLDTALANLRLHRRHPSWKPYVYYYVMFGQRGPATLLFLPYFCWVSWRKRSTTPLVMLGVALVLLNLSVGIVKIAIGRLGPLATSKVHDVFVGGNIYPSGHVSNTVVLYGLIAWIALRHRKAAIVAAVFLSVTVGLGTIYLRTHWFSDVIGGWLAGGLVLLALPTVMPVSQRWADTAVAWGHGKWLARRGRGEPAVPTPGHQPRPPAPPVRVAPALSTAAKKVGPVRSSTRPHDLVVTPSSRDAVEDPTLCG